MRLFDATANAKFIGPYRFDNCSFMISLAGRQAVRCRHFGASSHAFRSSARDMGGPAGGSGRVGKL